MVHKREYNKNWNFEEYKMSEYTHTIHSYPAMMMPRIARNVIQEYATSESIVLDPYMHTWVQEPHCLKEWLRT